MPHRGNWRRMAQGHRAISGINTCSVRMYINYHIDYFSALWIGNVSIFSYCVYYNRFICSTYIFYSNEKVSERTKGGYILHYYRKLVYGNLYGFHEPNSNAIRRYTNFNLSRFIHLWNFNQIRYSYHFREKISFLKFLTN